MHPAGNNKFLQIIHPFQQGIIFATQIGLHPLHMGNAGMTYIFFSRDFFTPAKCLNIGMSVIFWIQPYYIT